MVRDYLKAIWADLMARLCGFISLAFTLLGVYSTWLSGNTGTAHARWFWGIAVLTFTVTNYRVWADERKKVIAGEQRFLVAINRERPEVFATLSFGPGNAGTASIGLQNRGIKDAINIQILPISVEGSREGKRETKTLAFPCLACLPRKDEPSYPNLTINKIVDIDKEGELGFMLSNWSSRWNEPLLEFEMSVQWFDSGGNEFRSSSRFTYSASERKGRTRHGFIELVRPRLQ